MKTKNRIEKKRKNRKEKTEFAAFIMVRLKECMKKSVSLPPAPALSGGGAELEANRAAREDPPRASAPAATAPSPAATAPSPAATALAATGGHHAGGRAEVRVGCAPGVAF